jgi:hypothetical protein
MVDIPRFRVTQTPTQTQGEPRPERGIIATAGAELAGTQAQAAATAGQLALQSGAQIASGLFAKSDQFLDLVKKQKAVVEMTKAMEVSDDATLAIKAKVTELSQNKLLEPHQLLEEGQKVFTEAMKTAQKRAGEISPEALARVSTHLGTLRVDVLAGLHTEGVRRTVDRGRGALDRLERQTLEDLGAATPERSVQMATDYDSAVRTLVAGGALSAQEGEARAQKFQKTVLVNSYVQRAQGDLKGALEQLQTDGNLLPEERDALADKLLNRARHEQFLSAHEERKAEKVLREEQRLLIGQLVAEEANATDIDSLVRLKGRVSRLMEAGSKALDPVHGGNLVRHVQSRIEQLEARGETATNRASAAQDKVQRDAEDALVRQAQDALYSPTRPTHSRSNRCSRCASPTLRRSARC